MRKGVLSDESIRRMNPAFFPPTFFGEPMYRPPNLSERKHRGKPGLLPLHDLYTIAERTMLNPYDGAAQMVREYTAGTQRNATKRERDDTQFVMQRPDTRPRHRAETGGNVSHTRQQAKRDTDGTQEPAAQRPAT